EKNKKQILFFHSNLNSYKDLKIFKTNYALTNYVKNLSPLPIQFKKGSLDKLMQDESIFKNSKIFLVSSKFDFHNFSNYYKKFRLIKNNTNDYYYIDPLRKILIIKSIKATKGKIRCEISRLGNSSFKQDFFLNIETINNEVVYSNKHEIKENENNKVVNLSFPIEIFNQIKNIKIVEQNHAGAKYYFDDFSKKKNIAILNDNQFYKESPLLSPIYYLKKSLDAKHNIKIEKIDNIINQNYSTIIIPETVEIPKEFDKKLIDWLTGGGTLIRFSGDKLVEKESSFLPHQNTLGRLRNIEGQLTINNKLFISEFKKDSIFFGLQVPQDIAIKKQLIFNTNPKQVKVLAKLNDNTPLVSIKKIGEGEIILFHIGANNDWSNLPMSSLFSDMINRVLLLSKNYNYSNYTDLNLNKEIDGFGNLVPPKKIVNIDSFDKLKTAKPSLDTPPGQYENNQISVVLNLSTNINNHQIKITDTKVLSGYSFKSTRDLSSTILKIILIMFILDILLTTMIKNNINFSKIFTNRNNLLIYFLFFLTFIKSDFISANETYLAYVEIENTQINNISKNGLEKIRSLLITRTSVNPQKVIGIDIKTDYIYKYPFIYWPLTKNLLSIKKQEINKIKNYLNNGGIIFFDIIGFSRKSLNLKEKKFQGISDFLNEIGANELSIIPKEHTLTKSFYLLNKFPGKWDNRILFVETNNLQYKDGVSSIILGFNDWAKAWAVDNNNLPLFPVVPGGERQRELSYRFGINIAMYALTGNYKSDQIHSKSILKRLNKSN
ncbi:MAG: DUF4159 domain-containing protein, partial [Pseudomonadota bacterium]|nr:DUF4159 domain-containing protein [Pseudomonadota bacterium]